MELSVVQNYIDSPSIYREGKHYYYSHRVLDFEKQNNNLYAHVLGSSKKPYTVQISIDGMERIESSFCTCPSSGENSEVCKHIAAALLHYHKKYGVENKKQPTVLLNPLKENNAEIQETVIAINALQPHIGEGTNIISALEAYQAFDLKPKQGTTQYELVFIIEKDHSYYSNENNTLELWAQMDVLIPGLLGTLHHFKQRFTKKIEVEKDTQEMSVLREKIFPFILRRKKDEVLKELPKKTMLMLYSEMEADQKKVYEEYRNYYRTLITQKIEINGIEKSTMHIFSALLHLREIALFPELIDPQFKNVSSAKFEQPREATLSRSRSRIY